MKPRILTKCVAGSYAGRDERIAEFSFPGTEGPAGGLLSLGYWNDGRPLVTLYRVEGCDVIAGETVHTKEVRELLQDAERELASHPHAQMGSTKVHFALERVRSAIATLERMRS
jgi:hypothetical protein